LARVGLRGWPAAALVFVLSLAAYSFEIGDAPLGGTEGHRALTAHQMVVTGQWLVPKLYDRVYLAKPPLCYWIIGAFEKIVGHGNEWVWRLPSALASAALAAGLCLFSDAWFGAPAGIVAGLAHLALVVVWEQNRSAEVDAMNSAASVMAACGLIHLSFQTNRRRWVSMLGVALATAATLMIKGPAGLTIILGGLLGPPLFARKWKSLRRWEPWTALAIGFLCLGIYALAAYRAIEAEHLHLDLNGLTEAVGTVKGSIKPGMWHYVLALLVAPEVLIFALPVSLAIPLVLQRAVWNSPDENLRLRVRSIAGAIVIALAVVAASRLILPRYAYPILPMLCPLAGAAAFALPRQVKALTAISAIGIAIMAVALAIACRVEGNGQWLLAAIAAAGAALGAIVAQRKPGAIAVVMLLAMAPFAQFSDHHRLAERSAYGAAQKLAEIAAPQSVVVTGSTLMDQPELFYYAHVVPDSVLLDENAMPPPNHWLVIKDNEIDFWRARLGERLGPMTLIWPEKNMYAVWYSAAPATQP
jgi:4-amino-4-deoxy-L-arabinose transferase-like glycosyltransferase